MATGNLYIAYRGRVRSDAVAVRPGSDGQVEVVGPLTTETAPLVPSAAVVRFDSKFLSAPASLIGDLPEADDIRKNCRNHLGPGFFDAAGPCFYPPDPPVANRAMAILGSLIGHITSRESIVIARPTEKTAELAPELVPYRYEEPLVEAGGSPAKDPPAPEPNHTSRNRAAETCRTELGVLREKLEAKIGAVAQIKNKVVQKRMGAAVEALRREVQQKTAELSSLEELHL